MDEQTKKVKLKWELVCRSKDCVYMMVCKQSVAVTTSYTFIPVLLKEECLSYLKKA